VAAVLDQINDKWAFVKEDDVRAPPGCSVLGGDGRAL
jgi:hypothetical protein